MKKITLILAVMMFWGCSQADSQAEVKEEVKAKAEQVVAEKTEAAKDMAKEMVEAEVSEKVADATAAVKEEVKEKAVAAVSQVAQAAKADYQAGIHYRVINPAYNNEADEVVVYEFFGYTCPHCATFEPYMKKLESDLPEGAKIVRVPVVFGKQWEPYAKAYYTFEALGMTKEAHGPMFDAIHQHRKQFRTIDEIAVWAASSFGVEKDKFLSTAKSFMVDGQVRKGMQMLQAMGVTSTPTLVTNGKFVPNNKALKTRNDVIDITMHLVNQELAAMK